MEDDPRRHRVRRKLEKWKRSIALPLRDASRFGHSLLTREIRRALFEIDDPVLEPDAFP